MQQINIEKEGNLLSIKAPWNPLFIEELKKLHGKWNPDEKVWTVNDFAQEQLNVAIRRVFGNISGSAIETVKCSVVSEIKQEKTAITFLGKVIAAAKDKNTKMHHDDEVIYTIGEPTAGGSKNIGTALYRKAVNLLSMMCRLTCIRIMLMVRAFMHRYEKIL